MTENHGTCGRHIHIIREEGESAFNVAEMRNLIKQELGGENIDNLSTDDLIDTTIEVSWNVFIAAVEASISAEVPE